MECKEMDGTNNVKNGLLGLGSAIYKLGLENSDQDNV
jgi:hypothetical protein